MDKTVSVIVPAFNAEKSIEKCLDGLLRQTYPPAEIIIIDDGSTDYTPELADRYSTGHSSVVCIHQKNAGVSEARNRGLDAAQSEYILFVDSDDWVGEKYIETLMQYAEYDFVTCGFHLQNPMGEWEDMVFSDEAQTTGVIRRHPSVYMGKYYFGSPWAKLYKRELIDRGKLRFSREIHKGEDIYFNFAYLFQTDTVRIVPMCDYFYTFQASSLSNTRHPGEWMWQIEREKLIHRFFDCDSETERIFQCKREFGILKELLHANAQGCSDGQVHALLEEPLFGECIRYKKENGSFEDRYFLFTAERGLYFLYEGYLTVRNFKNRAVGHFRRKLSRGNRN